MIHYELERTAAALISGALLAAGAAPEPGSPMSSGGFANIMQYVRGALKFLGAGQTGVAVSDPVTNLPVEDARKVHLYCGMEAQPRQLPAIVVSAAADAADDDLSGNLLQPIEVRCYWPYSEAEGEADPRDLPGELAALADVVGGALLSSTLPADLNAVRPAPANLTVIGLQERTEGRTIAGSAWLFTYRLHLLCAACNLLP